MGAPSLKPPHQLVTAFPGGIFPPYPAIKLVTLVTSLDFREMCIVDRMAGTPVSPDKLPRALDDVSGTMS